MARALATATLVIVALLMPATAVAQEPYCLDHPEDIKKCPVTGALYAAVEAGKTAAAEADASVEKARRSVTYMAMPSLPATDYDDLIGGTAGYELGEPGPQAVSPMDTLMLRTDTATIERLRRGEMTLQDAAGGRNNVLCGISFRQRTSARRPSGYFVDWGARVSCNVRAAIENFPNLRQSTPSNIVDAAGKYSFTNNSYEGHKKFQTSSNDPFLIKVHAEIYPGAPNQFSGWVVFNDSVREGTSFRNNCYPERGNPGNLICDVFSTVFA